MSVFVVECCYLQAVRRIGISGKCLQENSMMQWEASPGYNADRHEELAQEDLRVQNREEAVHSAG